MGIVRKLLTIKAIDKKISRNSLYKRSYECSKTHLAVMIMYIFSKQDKYNDSLVIMGIVRKLLKIKIQRKNSGHVNIARKEDIAKLVFCEVFFLSGMRFVTFFCLRCFFSWNKRRKMIHQTKWVSLESSWQDKCREKKTFTKNTLQQELWLFKDLLSSLGTYLLLQTKKV